MTKKIFLRGVTMLLKEEKTAVIEANRTHLTTQVLPKYRSLFSQRESTT